MAAQKKNPNKSTPVEALTHDDTRKNIPTADSVSLVSESIKEPISLIYPRDPSLDPQLVWKGKDQQDTEDLVVDALPIFIQEKIDPRVLIENLREHSASNFEPELSLFDDFDGLSGMETVEYYQHDANWSNRLILGDSLEVMASLAERENLRGQVQMIYVDPPYGIKFGSNWQVRTSSRDVKDSIDDASRDVEQVKAFRDTWQLGIHSYLTYLRDRLRVATDLLTSSGSIFLQIGEENVHLVRSVLDEVFGSQNFVSMIAFVTTSGFAQASALSRNGDYILWYAKDINLLKSHTLWIEANDRQGYTWLELADGSRRSMTASEKRGEVELPEGSRVYKPSTIVSSGGASSPQPFEFEGKTYNPPANNHWKANYPLGMERLVMANRIHKASNSIQYVRYENDFGYKPLTNLWTDTATGNFTETKTFVVQTATKVIERCIQLCSDPGDLVLDPTCGSGTTAYAAERLGRRWITCDTSRVAVAVTRSRLIAARHPYFILFDSVEGQKKNKELGGTQDQAQPTNNLRRGFVYNRVPHVTLKDIANNTELHRDMSQTEIAESIRRNSESEILFDSPIQDIKRIRVSGPFSVESLSPHRALSATTEMTASEGIAISDPKQKSYETMLLENLITSGIQNGRKSERFEFESFQPAAGGHIFAEIIAKENVAVNGRIGVSIGPRYGTVGVDLIKDAAREAVKGKGFSILLVLGFAFDPQSLEAVAEFAPPDENGFEVGEGKPIGDLRILLVRMNADLAMGEKLLKKSKAANLFTVFGEPDVGQPTKSADGWTLEINGFDVYNPISGEVRSGSATDIAMWMIDTNYNGESFFVRHAYFPGGDDPYKKLKSALKADIDAEAWETLNSTVSRPFPTPTTGKIAVKIINDYGDEVMKVIEIKD